MQCHINRIHIVNFMSFGEQTFDFDKRHGITTIVGLNNDIPGATNGSGKSTLFIAVYYALFGKEAIKTKNKFLKNRYSSSTLYYIDLWLTIDGKKFRIQRGSEGNESFLKLFSIMPDNQEVEITKSSISDTEFFLKCLLANLTSDIFLKTVLLSPIMGQNFFLLSHKDKTEFLNLLSGTKILYDINSLLGKEINNLNTDIKILENSIIDLSKQIDVLEQKKTDFVNRQNELKEFHDKRKSELQAKIKDDNEKLISEIDNLEKLRADNEKIESEIRELEDKQSKLKIEIVKKTSNIKSIQSKNEQIDKFIEKNKNIREIVCSDCLSKIDNILNMSSLLKAKDKNKNSIENETKLIESLKSEMNLIPIKEAKERYNEFRDKSNEVNMSVVSLKKSIESNRMMIETLDNNFKSTNGIEPFSEMIMTNENAMKDKKSQKEQQTKERQKLAILKFMTNDDIIHKFVTSQFAKDINIYMSKFLAAMGVNYTVTFDNSFNYEFMTPGGEVSYDTFSSGEKMRLNIAISFVFRRLLFKYLNINVNLLVLDEYVDSALDKLAINGIINLLNEIKIEEPQSSIFVISHRSEILSQIGGNKLVICKTNGISKIIEE